MIKYLLTAYLILIPNSFAESRLAYWDFVVVNKFVVNIYYDNDNVASIQRLSSNDDWSLYCYDYTESHETDADLSYTELMQAFEDAKRKCKKYPW